MLVHCKQKKFAVSWLKQLERKILLLYYSNKIFIMRLDL